MKLTRYIIKILICLFALPLHAESDFGGQMKRYADEYAKCENAQKRLKLANEFFAFLLQEDYIDEPIAFPAGSHIDSVDVNVWYYVAEWYYGEGDYQVAVDYCSRATECMGVVDDSSKSDVYALMGAVYFRMSAFDKAVEALNQSYKLDKKGGDFDRMSSTLNSIASVFVAAGKPQEAEKYVLEAIAANSLTENLTRRAVLYGTASEMYRSMGDSEQSLEFARKALDTERLRGDSARIGVRLSQLASAQLSLSQIGDARQSLQEAIPLLFRSGNLHSWGICQNQMGDILASEGKNDKAAACYLEAAMLFLKQGDKYNELHAREGLYNVMKSSSPSDAMMHIERAKLLQDSIYKHDTGEALGKYNAIYFNDILQKEKERTERREHILLISTIILLVIIVLGIVLTYCHQKRKQRHYEQHLSTMQDQNELINKQFQNMLADTIPDADNLTEDDRQFLSQLTSIVSAAIGKGNPDIEALAEKMHINGVTLRRRLYQTMAVTPKAFIHQVRMKKAKHLLQNYRDLTIADVAEKCGYSQVSNFTRAFKKYYGVMPSTVKVVKE